MTALIQSKQNFIFLHIIMVMKNGNNSDIFDSIRSVDDYSW